MNILFLELEKVINNSTVNLFNQRTIEGTVYNTTPDFVENLNKLIKDHSFYIVLTSLCKNSIPHEDVLYVLNELGIDSLRLVDTLFDDPSVEKMKRIQAYFSRTRLQIDNYFVLDNYENIQPSPDEHIFLVANGLNKEEYLKCDNRIKKSFKKEVNTTPSSTTPSQELQNCSTVLIKQQNEISLKQTKREQDTNEALYLLTNNISYFKDKYSSSSTYVAREKTLSYLTEKFPKADEGVLEKALTSFGFLRPVAVTKVIVTPLSLISLAPYHFFTDLSTIGVVIAGAATFIALDILSWVLFDNKVIKTHTIGAK